MEMKEKREWGLEKDGVVVVGVNLNLMVVVLPIFV